MKKVLTAITILFIIFIGMVYWSVSSTDKEFKTCEIKDFDDLEKVNFKEHDSVLVAPSTLYEGNFLKEFMQGRNYRETWSTPVKVPIAFLDTLKGGLEIIKKGGGKQTHSLKLKNKAGIVFTLRSVTKDPKKLIPEIAEDLGLQNIIVDGISGQHPYGAILAARLAERANILHTHPKMYFIPKQERLGKYNDTYGNRLYLLEYETESETNWTTLKDVLKIIETNDLQELKLREGEKLSIDREALIKARLFDMLIGDWDRHAEQWGWAIQKSGSKLRAIPIPGDRDNAFFNLKGIIPSIITNKNIEPLVRPYEKDIDYMPGLIYPFDRYFLLDTPESVYLEQAKNLQESLTPAVIDEAFQVWPDQISELDKKEISEKLKSRRRNLKEFASDFYSILQEQGGLKEALKGSEDLDLQDSPLLRCFECK